MKRVIARLAAREISKDEMKAAAGGGNPNATLCGTISVVGMDLEGIPVYSLDDAYICDMNA